MKLINKVMNLYITHEMMQFLKIENIVKLYVKV